MECGDSSPLSVLFEQAFCLFVNGNPAKTQSGDKSPHSIFGIKGFFEKIPGLFA